jgi:hypothetical protein
MSDLAHGKGALHADSEFLPEFPVKGGEDGFTGLYLPAGKLPQSALMTLGMTQRHQHLIVCIYDEPYSDMDKLIFRQFQLR